MSEGDRSMGEAYSRLTRCPRLLIPRSLVLERWRHYSTSSNLTGHEHQFGDVATDRGGAPDLEGRGRNAHVQVDRGAAHAPAQACRVFGDDSPRRILGVIS